jgi:hypothetical protein
MPDRQRSSRRHLVAAVAIGFAVAAPAAHAQFAPDHHRPIRRAPEVAPEVASEIASGGAIDCTTAHWSSGHPAINIGHIFCGEIRRRPDGYHSEAIAPTPFVTRVERRQDIGDGVYNGTVIFANGDHKFSTFYPRACSVGQIVASIRYAVSQPRTPKSDGWGFVAASAPADRNGGDAFCRGSDGRPFTIRFATLSRGDINTAFPDSP